MAVRSKTFEVPVIPRECSVPLRAFLIELGRRIGSAVRVEDSSYAVKQLIGPITITDELIGGRFSNANAVDSLTVTLPPAKVGMELEFTVDAAYSIIVTPAAGEKFQLVSADSSVVLDELGDLLRISCIVEGEWRNLCTSSVPTVVVVIYADDAVWGEYYSDDLTTTYFDDPFAE